MKGKVYLVGAGPGDPELLTVRAARLIEKADVILYDRLVSSRVLESARADAVLHFVGKQEGCHFVPQEEISRLLVEYAERFGTVVRLKGGDPFVFGRGGEEYEEVYRAGIDVEVVPGISAALGASAAAGIPLTHRDYSSGIVFLTGHRRHDALLDDFAGLSFHNKTFVIYMGLSQLESIVQRLMETNPALLDVPAAVVEKATMPDQRVITATIGTICAKAREAEIRSPALVIAGEVVRFPSERLQRFFSQASRH